MTRSCFARGQPSVKQKAPQWRLLHDENQCDHPFALIPVMKTYGTCRWQWGTGVLAETPATANYQLQRIRPLKVVQFWVTWHQPQRPQSCSLRLQSSDLGGHIGAALSGLSRDRAFVGTFFPSRCIITAQSRQHTTAPLSLLLVAFTTNTDQLLLEKSIVGDLFLRTVSLSQQFWKYAADRTPGYSASSHLAPKSEYKGRRTRRRPLRKSLLLHRRRFALIRESPTVNMAPLRFMARSLRQMSNMVPSRLSQQAVARDSRLLLAQRRTFTTSPRRLHGHVHTPKAGEE